MNVVAISDAALRQAVAAAGLDNLDGAFAYGGGDDLNKPNLGSRRRTRVTLRDNAGNTHALYLKRYGPAGLGQRLKQWLTTLGRTSVAWVEFDAITQARAAGVPTMEALAFGQGNLLTDGRSFLLVSTVPGDALERVGERLLGPTADAALADCITTKLANLVWTFHRAGLVHRDLYAAHVFVDVRGSECDLYLIDLARVFRPRWRSFRWRVKDLAALHFSMPEAWVQQHWVRFLRLYLGVVSEKESARWIKAIHTKSQWMRRRAEAKMRNAERGMRNP